MPERSYSVMLVPPKAAIRSFVIAMALFCTLSDVRSQEPDAGAEPSAETIAKVQAYATSIVQRIQENWIRPRRLRNNFECVIRLTQDSSGMVVEFKLHRTATDLYYVEHYASALGREMDPVIARVIDILVAHGI